jgi:hypothetical protein
MCGNQSLATAARWYLVGSSKRVASYPRSWASCRTAASIEVFVIRGIGTWANLCRRPLPVGFTPIRRAAKRDPTEMLASVKKRLHAANFGERAGGDATSSSHRRHVLV